MKIRRLVDANIIGIVIWNVAGRIIEANDAFLDMVGYSRDDLVAGRMRWIEMTPAEWRVGDPRRWAEMQATGRSAPVEKEYFRKDGSRVPVLVGAATLEGRRDAGVDLARTRVVSATHPRQQVHSPRPVERRPAGEYGVQGRA